MRSSRVLTTSEAQGKHTAHILPESRKMSQNRHLKSIPENISEKDYQKDYQKRRHIAVLINDDVRVIHPLNSPSMKCFLCRFSIH